MGIEPTSKAWEAFVLPLNYTRECLYSRNHVGTARSGVASRAVRGPLLNPTRAPPAKTWEAFVLPLNYTRNCFRSTPPRGFFARSGVASRAVRGSLLRPSSGSR
jgi:hypothetical protein